MRRFFLSGYCVAAVVAVCAIGRPAVAQRPDILRHYQIVPRLSTLEITGGFAGVREEYRLIGQYDLLTGWRHEDPWAGYARFDNAEVWGSIISDDPVIAIVLDVDERLNLEGLKGEQLPVAAPFDVYKFTGQTSDGSDLTLFASVLGPWMRVRGRSQPPPGSADFFDYELHMVAHTRPFADYNGDGVVDAADYTLLMDTATSDAAGAGVEGSAWDTWRSQFGDRPPDFSTVDGMLGALLDGPAAATAIPEPTTGLLLLPGLALCAHRRARR